MQKRMVLLILVCTCCVGRLWADITIDADYPGGNIVLERIEDDTVYLHQDLRDTVGWWFYWNFRVRGAAGRSLTFHFTNKNVFGTRGPAVSLDEGDTWSWLGHHTVQDTSFRYRISNDADCVRFAFAIPYLESDLNDFLKPYEQNRHLRQERLCTTRKGRAVRRLHIGQLNGIPEHRLLLTCRHHACESSASYVLEGMMAALLADTKDGRWMREHVEVLIVPFMDKDGVQEGDQGKNRSPRDHNRDYADESLYASTGALRELVPTWSDARLRMAIDLHSPWIRGPNNEVIYLVGSAHETIWKAQCAFSHLLETVCGDGLPYRASDNIPFGTAWNTSKNYTQGMSFSRWASTLEGIRLATTIEVPYANAGTVTMTPELARPFGGALVTAIRQYLGLLSL